MLPLFHFGLQTKFLCPPIQYKPEGKHQRPEHLLERSLTSLSFSFFSPSEWIRSKIRQGVQIRKPDSTKEREEARDKAVEKGSGSVFDVVDKALEARASPMVGKELTPKQRAKLEVFTTSQLYLSN